MGVYIPTCQTYIYIYILYPYTHIFIIYLSIYIYMYTGWWFGTLLLFSIQLGMSSSQLTNCDPPRWAHYTGASTCRAKLRCGILPKKKTLGDPAAFRLLVWYITWYINTQNIYIYTYRYMWYVYIYIYITSINKRYGVGLVSQKKHWFGELD